MKNSSIIPLLLTLLAAVLIAASSPAPRHTNEHSEAARAKAAYLLWEQTGVASPRDEDLISRYYFPNEMPGRNPLDTQGGPDAFGYYWVDNQAGDTATFNWIELAGDPSAVHLLGSEFVPNVDNSLAALIPIGFDFPFYGVVQDSLRISTNGNLQFGTLSASPLNTCTLPTPPLGAALMPFWDDLHLARNGSINGDNKVHYKTDGALFIVEWDSVGFASAGNPGALKFQVLLYANGRIKFQYHSMSGNLTGATTAIQQGSGGTALTYGCNGVGQVPVAGRAVWFHVPPAVPFDFECAGIVNPQGKEDPGSTVQVAMQIYNRGLNDAGGIASYRFSGGDWITEFTPIIPAGQVIFHPFATLLGPLPPGEHELETVCSAFGDNNLQNDTCRTLIRVMPCADAVINAPGVYSSTTCGAYNDCPYRPGQDQIVQVNIPYVSNWTIQLCHPTVNWDTYLILSDQCCAGNIAGADDDNCPEFGVGHAQIACTTLSAGTYYVDIEPFAALVCSTFTLQVIDCNAPGCIGTIRITAEAVTFPNTYVGSSSFGLVTVHNDGTQELCVDSIATGGHIFTAVPQSFVVPPGLSQQVDIVFSPTFTHDFDARLVVYSSDVFNPVVSTSLIGTGCEAVLTPPPPRLFDAASPSDIYFAMPWSDNDETVEYAIEYSPDGFGTSNFVDFPFGESPIPVFMTDGLWGNRGAGLIGDLIPNTIYGVRLHARDCLGAISIGPAAIMATRRDIAPEINAQLTIKVFHPDSVLLTWNPAVNDSSGQPLPSEGCGVFFGTSPDSVDSLVNVSDDGSIHMPIDAAQPLGFFLVHAFPFGVFDEPKPFISWPPDGAVIAGTQAVVLQDAAHLMQWDSFRVEIDSAGFPALIGSSWDNPWLESNTRAAVEDFTRFGNGPHTITATVVDDQNRTWVNSINVDLVAQPIGNFTAQYDSVSRMYTLDTTDVHSAFPVDEILWQTENGGEYYGTPIQFQAMEDESLKIVKLEILKRTAFPPPLRILADIELQLRKAALAQAKGGVQPVPAQPAVEEIEIACCCENLVVVCPDSGAADSAKGTYFGQKKIPLGARFSLSQSGGKLYLSCSVSFEVEVTYKYIKAPAQDCFSGQDAKTTTTVQEGYCTAAPNRNFVPFTDADAISHKSDKVYKNTSFPRSGDAYGNDDCRPDNNGGNVDQSKIGKTRWVDSPTLVVPIVDNASFRFKYDGKFIAVAGPPCPNSNTPCCKEWEVLMDFTRCKEGDFVFHTYPKIRNVTTPAVCPTLAPN